MSLNDICNKHEKNEDKNETLKYCQHVIKRNLQLTQTMIETIIKCQITFEINAKNIKNEFIKY